MICCAVGICAITELKREKNSVQTSNSPSSKSATIFLAIISACSKPMVRTPRSSIVSMICLLVDAAQLIVALAADAENLDLFALGHQRIGLLARKPHDRRIESAAQAAFGGADDQKMRLVVAGAGEQPRRGIAPATAAAIEPSTLPMRSA